MSMPHDGLDIMLPFSRGHGNGCKAVFELRVLFCCFPTEKKCYVHLFELSLAIVNEAT